MTKDTVKGKPVLSDKEAEEASFNGQSFPVVGIGAFAGGLSAFEALFSGMPSEANPGMAFVLVPHLAPDPTSIITEVVRTRDVLEKANEHLRLAVIVRDSHDAITVQDLEGRTIAWNPGAVRIYGWSEAEALKMNLRERIPEHLRKGAMARLLQLGQAVILEPYRTERITKQGAVVKASIISTALLDETGTMYAVATTERVEEGDAK